jgi:toxin ParE1/3/4
MNSYSLSNKAALDIEEIAEYSITNWGFARAERYILDLHRAFETLAEFPHLGRDAGHLRPGYFRFEHDRHSVFYRKMESGVFIVRVLHMTQQADNHL